MGHLQPTCDAPPLSDAEVKGAIDRARATRTDLLAPFPEYRSSVKKRGCYYVYIEYRLPEAPDSNHIITLNQHGAIVDMQAGRSSFKLQCPSKVFTENELAEILRTELGKRGDLPPPLENVRTRVDRLRCLYLYFEHNVPEQRGDYQVFTIDPFGELMWFSRSQPYWDVSRGSWKKNGALHSVIRVSDQAATSACSRTSLRRW